MKPELRKMTENDTILRRTSEDLLRMQNAFQEFAHAVSHNLRGPLSGILGLTMMAEAESNQEYLGEIIGMIKSKAQEVDHIVHDLNQIVSSHKGAHDIHQLVIIEELLNDLVDDFPGNAHERIQLNLANSSILTSLESVRNILFQLLDNALKYGSSEEHSIRVETKSLTGNLQIQITDSGIGIDPDKLEEVFKPYYRDNWNYPGKGLGLYLARLQTEMLGGILNIHSELGKGTTVTLTLPNDISQSEHLVLDSTIGKFTYYPAQSSMVASWNENMDADGFDKFFPIIAKFIKRYRTVAWIADIRETFNDETELNKVRQKFKTRFDYSILKALIIVVKKEELEDPNDARNLKTIQNHYQIPVYFATTIEEALNLAQTMV